VADVHLGHLRHNVHVLQQRADGAPLMGVVKADAYGHGLHRVAPVLHDAGVRHFAVATVPEALALHDLELDASILIFGAPLPEYLPTYARYGFEVTVSSQAVAEAVMRTAREVGPLRIHLKVDTGMGRIGVAPDDVAPLVQQLDRAPGITLAGLWTHFATTDEAEDDFAREQLDRFAPVWETVGDAFEVIHTANSGSLLAQPELFAPFERTLVRTGITLYGLGPAPWLDATVDLRPILRLSAPVVHLKTVDAGTPISYGRLWRAPRRTRIATVAAGYADGYPRLLSNRAEVGIRGARYPVVGAICMDMFMVDLGPPDGEGGTVTRGDEVVLFGEGGPSVFQVAAWAQTIPYEICCGLGRRVLRRYAEPS
jgi:alanine racemase